MIDSEQPTPFPAPPVDPGRLVYLSVPYDKMDSYVQNVRLAAKIAAKLSLDGMNVVSPLIQASLLNGLDKDFNAWKRYSEIVLCRCQMLMVVTADGWKESAGVAEEMKTAEKLGIQIGFYQP